VALSGLATRLASRGRPPCDGAPAPVESLRRIDDDDVAARLVAEMLMLRHGIAPRHREAVVAAVRRDWPLARAWLQRRYGPGD
jgi:hypothetical protein